MTQEGRRWYPEPFYIFATAVIIDLPTREILFTRSRDREEWIPGAGGEVIIPADTSKPILLQTTAIRETAEELCTQTEKQLTEVGLAIQLYGPCAFYMEALCGESSHYPDAHGLYAYFLAELVNPEEKNQIYSKKQPEEEDCETIGIQWMTAEAFMDEISLGFKKTYPNIIRVLHTLQWILQNQTNPFFQPWQKPKI